MLLGTDFTFEVERIRFPASLAFWSFVDGGGGELSIQYPQGTFSQGKSEKDVSLFLKSDVTGIQESECSHASLMV